MTKKIFAFIFLLVVLVAPLSVSAQFGAATAKLNTVAKGTGLTSDFAGSISTVITGVLSLAGTIFLVLTVYAGILWMTAQGNEDKVSKAKDMITQAIIGLAITLGAYAITAFVTGKLSNSSSGIEPSNNTPVNAPAQTNDLVGSMKPCNAQGEGEKNGWCINKSKSKDVPLNCSTVSIPGSGQCDADEDCCL